MKSRWLLFLPAALWAAGAFADANPTPPAAPSLAIGDQAIRVSGLTPGGGAVWFGMGRGVDDDDVPIVTYVAERMIADDQDGAVEL